MVREELEPLGFVAAKRSSMITCARPGRCRWCREPFQRTVRRPGEIRKTTTRSIPGSPSAGVEVRASQSKVPSRRSTQGSPPATTADRSLSATRAWQRGRPRYVWRISLIRSSRWGGGPQRFRAKSINPSKRAASS